MSLKNQAVAILKKRANIAAGVLTRQPIALLYIVEARDVRRCKIGLATDIRHRFAAVQSGSPLKLRLHAYYRLPRQWASRFECCVHMLLAGHRLHGEWFECSPWEAATAVDETFQLCKEVT